MLQQAVTGQAYGAVTSRACPVCGDGPCSHPWEQGRVPESYPFLTSEQIMTINERAAVATEEPVEAPTAIRGRRRSGMRAHTPGENRAHHPSDDR